jgi:hypothetical protein
MGGGAGCTHGQGHGNPVRVTWEGGCQRQTMSSTTVGTTSAVCVVATPVTGAGVFAAARKTGGQGCCAGAGCGCGSVWARVFVWVAGEGVPTTLEPRLCAPPSCEGVDPVQLLHNSICCLRTSTTQWAHQATSTEFLSPDTYTHTSSHGHTQEAFSGSSGTLLRVEASVHL